MLLVVGKMDTNMGLHMKPGRSHWEDDLVHASIFRHPSPTLPNVRHYPKNASLLPKCYSHHLLLYILHRVHLMVVHACTHDKININNSKKYSIVSYTIVLSS